MQVQCPSCRVELPLDDVNVATDVALCRRCGQTHSFAALSSVARAGEVDLSRPPEGAWFSRSLRGFEVGGSTRSPIAFFLVPFMCVWSGASLGSIYGRQIMQGKFELSPSLIGIPFLIGTLIFGSVALMAVFGKVVVKVEGDDGEIFTGIGSLGWRRRFAWREMKRVHVTERRQNRRQVEQITLEGQRRIHLASGLSADRRHFMLAALTRMLAERR